MLSHTPRYEPSWAIPETWALHNEETFRFVKQSYQVEDIRVLRYQRLKNLILLVTAVASFAATFLGQKLKLKIPCENLLIISRRFFGIPPFRFYALADGIRTVLNSAKPISEPESPPGFTTRSSAGLGVIEKIRLMRGKPAATSFGASISATC